MLDFSYDKDCDILTVEGKRYSGHFFRFFSEATVGRKFQIVKTKNGAIAVVDLKK